MPFNRPAKPAGDVTVNGGTFVPSRQADNNERVAAKKSFTGDKLDWMTAVMADPRLDARAFEVGFCIAQHVNQQTGAAFLSDDTISDKTGIPKRWVLRARRNLKEAGWIDWRRTGGANVYWTLGAQMNAVTDHQVMLRDARNEKRHRAQSARNVTPSVAHLRNPDAPPIEHQKLPPAAEQE